MRSKMFVLPDSNGTDGFLTNFMNITDAFIERMAKHHGFMDRVEKREPWEKKNLERYNLNKPENKLTEEQQAWFDKWCDSKTDPKHNKKWKKIVFYQCQYCVQRKGDIHALITGINNSGKTNTAVMMLKFANRVFRECFKVNEDADEPGKGKLELHKFNLDLDVMYDPDPSVLNSLLEEDKFYQTIDITEGLGSATNLQSMDKKVIRLGIKAYRMRYRRDLVYWEYQITDRPPKLLITRFNCWIHKMNINWGVLSIPSSFYRTRDPLYLKRIEEIADSDTRLARWFTNNRQNPNYVIKFKTPHMGPKMQSHFNKNMMAAEKRMMEKEELESKHSGRFLNIAIDMWKTVNIDHFKVEDELQMDLVNKGMNKGQIDRIMKIYSEYDATKKYLQENKQKKFGKDLLPPKPEDKDKESDKTGE